MGNVVDKSYMETASIPKWKGKFSLGSVCVSDISAVMCTEMKGQGIMSTN